jgi:hypothetical protein
MNPSNAFLQAAGTVMLLATVIYSVRIFRWLSSADFRATADFWWQALVSIFRR